eukprot:14131605-Ditylum_brightwellii.AAC.1
MSLDIVNMYPSMFLSLIKQAGCYYSQNMSVKEKKTIEKCLATRAVDMRSTFVKYQEKYYNYKGVITKGGEHDNGMDKMDCQ